MTQSAKRALPVVPPQPGQVYRRRNDTFPKEFEVTRVDAATVIARTIPGELKLFIYVEDLTECDLVGVRS